MRSERGSVPAKLAVVVLLVAFGAAAFLLLSGDDPDTNVDEGDAAALAMTTDDASEPDERADERDTEREATAAEETPGEVAEAAEDDDAIPPDATGVTGIVIDKTGLPAVEVEVTIGRKVGRKDAEKYGVVVPDGKTSARYERSAMTDGTGRFTIIELKEAENFQIQIETDAGRIGRQSGVSVIEKLVRDVGEIPLRDGARVKGLVRSESGAPVKGADITFGWDWSADPLVSDDQGRFDAGVLFPGKHQIRVKAKGYALPDNMQREFVEGDVVDDLVLILVPAAPVTGRVVDAAGRGIPEAWVNINRQGRTMFSYFHDQVTSGANGAFAFDSIPAGDYDINAGKSGYRYANESDVTAGGAPIELRLEKAGRIDGVVLDARTSTPIEAERIQLWWVPPWQKNDPNAGLQQYWSDGKAECKEDGTFTIGLDDGGTFVAEAFADGYAPGRSERFELEANGTVTGIVVRLEEGRSLSMLARDAETGAPIAGAVLNVHVAPEKSEGGGGNQMHQLMSLGHTNGFAMMDASVGHTPTVGERVDRLVTDEEGRAICKSIFPGSFVVVGKRTGYAAARVEGIEVGRAADPTPIELSFTHGGAVEGRVTNDRGAPEPAIRVFANNKEGRAGEIVTDADGAYRIENLSEGRYAIDAENPDESKNNQEIWFGGNNSQQEQSEAEKWPIVVEEGGVATKDLVIERVTPGQLAGTVLVNGTPTPDVQVMANFVNPNGEQQWDWGNATRTDKMGAFQFRRLKPGKYNLLVHRSWSQMYTGGDANVTAGIESRVTVDVGLGGIAGIVVDESGKPIKGVNVRANKQQTERQRFSFGGGNNTSTKDDGRFGILDLQEGTYSLRLHRQGYVTATEKDLVVNARRETSGLRLEMKAGGWLQVTVAGATKGTRLQFSVQFEGQEKPRRRWVRLDSEGSGWMELGTTEGRGQLTVKERGDNPRTATAPIAMEPGKNAEVTLSFN